MSDGLRTLVVLTAYDPAISGTRTLYVTNGTGFITGASDTPAHTPFLPLLKQPLNVTRRVQGIAGERIKPSLGELTVHNGDGALDGWLDYAFDGRAVVVRIGPATQGAYPTAYPVRFTGTVDRVDVEGDVIRIRLRDEVTVLDNPLQETLYTGLNVLPAGLEGVDDLKGAPKPLVFGDVRNIPLPCVNTSKLIYQVSDSAVNAVVSAYDSGVLLGHYAPIDFAQTHATIGGQSAATNGSVIVVGDGGGAPGPRIRTTTDGATFTTIAGLPFISTGAVSGLAYAGDAGLTRFCAVTDNATGEIATSDDSGSTWTIQTAAAAVVFRRVRRDTKRALFIAIGNGGAIHTSPTGVTWTARTSGVAGILRDVAVDGPLIVAVGAAGALTTSPTGVTWTATTLGTATLWSALYSAPHYFVGSESTGAGVYRSLDAVQWTVVFAPASTAYTMTAAEGWVVVMTQVGLVDPHFANTRDGGISWQDVGMTGGAGTPQQVVAFGDRFYGFNQTTTARSGAPSAYASLADLSDDTLAPSAGSYKYFFAAAGSYIRLGSPAAGQITADVTQGAADANRTAGQLVAAVLTEAGYTAGEWSASDITALDTAENGVCGLYVVNGETTAECLDMLARTVGAFWYVDAAGVIRIQQLTAPSGTSTFSAGVADIGLRTLARLASSDPLRNLPSHRTTLRYARHWTVQTDGLAGGVSAARRADLAREWREVMAESASVLTTHLLAQATVEETLFAESADASGEATRRQTLRGTQRDAFTVTVPLADFDDVELGAVGTLTHTRYGLSAGVAVRCLGVAPDAERRIVTLTLWR